MAITVPRRRGIGAALGRFLTFLVECFSSNQTVSRVRNSGERMSGRERTGADFYPPPPGFRSPFRSPGRPAPKIQAASVGKKKLTPF